LEEQQDEHDDADDGVVVVDEADGRLVDHVEAEAECGDVHGVGEDLECGVDEPEAWEGGQADEDGTYGEEYDEGKGGEHAVGNEYFLSVGSAVGEVEASTSEGVGVPATSSAEVVVSAWAIASAWSVLCKYGRN